MTDVGRIYRSPIFGLIPTAEVTLRQLAVWPPKFGVEGSPCDAARRPYFEAHNPGLMRGESSTFFEVLGCKFLDYQRHRLASASFIRKRVEVSRKGPHIGRANLGRVREKLRAA
jgi:hypothetical protein